MPTCTSALSATIVPFVELPPATPFTSHVTAVLVLVVVVEFERFTTAVNCVIPLIGTVAVVGVIATEVTVPGAAVPLPQPAVTKRAASTNPNTPTVDVPFVISHFPLEDERALFAPPRITQSHLEADVHWQL